MGYGDRNSKSRRPAFLRLLVFCFHDPASFDDEARSAKNTEPPFRPEEAMVGAARHFSAAHKVRFVYQLSEIDLSRTNGEPERRSSGISFRPEEAMVAAARHFSAAHKKKCQNYRESVVMVKSAKSQLDDEDEAEDYDSSSYRGDVVKAESKSSELKTNANRSKHSETEQRRRSKINERQIFLFLFQALRDLIPQNDQKRDKASFLLEVIEYIQFLQEKLQMYEGSYEGLRVFWTLDNLGFGALCITCTLAFEHVNCNHDLFIFDVGYIVPYIVLPSKWFLFSLKQKNYRASAESILDHTQAVKNGSAHENTVMLANVHNSVESDMGVAAMYKALDDPPGSTNPAIPFDVQTPLNVLAAVGRGGVPTQSLQESVSDAENMAHQLQSQLLHGRPCPPECTTPNNTLNGQENMESDSRSVNLSNAYSQR
ncbi:unnamed protein product [Dovyalis caffra]|uniref:BHLH domain-containing protein n=1 Tax=Dovyalis caffra TaxID=77055 RepID=A0AAV1RET6_9ROSI|nr:unnamed protein product [Dovyalis caffra]